MKSLKQFMMDIGRDKVERAESRQVLSKHLPAIFAAIREIHPNRAWEGDVRSKPLDRNHHKQYIGNGHGRQIQMVGIECPTPEAAVREAARTIVKLEAMGFKYQMVPTWRKSTHSPKMYGRPMDSGYPFNPVIIVTGVDV